MPYSMHVDVSRALLDLRYHGIVSIAQRLEAWGEAKPLLERTGVRRILIDLMQAIPAQEPVGHHSEFAARLTSEPLLLESRTAFVAPPVHPVNHLIEVLADARHYPFSRFTDREQAIAWLLDDAAPPAGLRL